MGVDGHRWAVASPGTGWPSGLKRNGGLSSSHYATDMGDVIMSMSTEDAGLRPRRDRCSSRSAELPFLRWLLVPAVHINQSMGQAGVRQATRQ